MRAFRDHPDANFTVVPKGTERYIYVYSDETVDQLATVLARHVEDRTLSLTHADAVGIALVTRRVCRN